MAELFEGLPARVKVMGVPIDPWTMAQTVEATSRIVETGGFAHPIGANADKLLQMRDDSRITRMVCNRDASTFDEWIDLDLLDIRTRDAWTDVKLIGKTAGSILTEQES